MSKKNTVMVEICRNCHGAIADTLRESENLVNAVRARDAEALGAAYKALADATDRLNKGCELGGREDC